MSTWPNQLYYKGGSTYLGHEFNSRVQVLSQLTPPDQRKRPVHPPLSGNFFQKTDGNGKAILRGIPIGANESLTLRHSKFTLPIDRYNGRDVSYKIESIETKRLELMTLEISP